MAESAQDLSAASLEAPARTGYLWKQSQWVKKWKKRWFVLWPNSPHRDRGRMLFYYLTPQDKRPRGVINLVPGSFTLMTTEGRTVKDRDFPLCLVIKLHKKRAESFLLATDSETEVMAWATAINSIQAVEGDGVNPQTDVVFSSTMLRDQLARDSDDEGDGGAAGGAARAARIRDAADEEEDVMDILIKLDAASSERDQLASSQAALQSALQVLLPSADLSRPEKLLEQAKHTASDRANAQQLRQELGLAKRRMDEMERAREAEQGRQRHDEEQLHEELQELRAIHSTLRGDEQLAREQLEALREELRQAEWNQKASQGPGGAEDGEDEELGPPPALAELEQQRSELAELEQLRLEDRHALAEAEKRIDEMEEEHGAKRRELETMLVASATKNRQLASRLESRDSSASSHG